MDKKERLRGEIAGEDENIAEADAQAEKRAVEMESLRGRRAAAVRLSMTGKPAEKEQAEKEISSLTELMERKGLEIEYYKGLGDDARKRKSDRERALKEIQRAEAAALEAYLNKRRNEKILELIRQQEPREQRMKELWVEFNVLLGEMMVDDSRIGNHPAKLKHNLGFMAQIVNFPETQGFRKCLQPGYMGQWQPWAILKHGTEKGIVNPADVAQARDEEDRAAWTAEWEKERGL